ncbi:hypothetical protein D1AOALGA4SA_13119 [Olavius algarvensis Delta 1 endosymbiont]|nr:hypothetical protein D1AOALGA4SA_13119 [Olavius algarvensis Delta 1 endosymbiont]
MNASPTIDLSRAPVVDAHCHGFTRNSLTSATPDRWLDRITFMGMCLDSSFSADKNLSKIVPQMTESTLLALKARRLLAGLLDCPVEKVADRRREELERDSQAYIARLFTSENLAGLFVDDGYPLPRIPSAEFANLVGVPAHRVVRIEPLIETARLSTAGLDGLVEKFSELLQEAADDPATIAYKSIIAYRTGLDVNIPDRTTVPDSYECWRESGWQESRQTSKAVRDHLLNITLDIARERNLPVHIHTGGGDPDVLLEHARPSLLSPLLKSRMSQPVVLIHGGYPWIEETAFLASIYPLVYVDLSVVSPWNTIFIERALELFLGMLPAGKLLHGSDEASEPELIWLAAHLTRFALERVLAKTVDQGYLTPVEAETIGRGILAGNALRLHGLA